MPNQWLATAWENPGDWLGLAAAKNRVSTGAALLAAWGAFLHRLTGQAEMGLWLVCPGPRREHGTQNLETRLFPVRSRFGPE
ncbi:MAG TPA: hypothetical protein VGD78_04775, partial [Chthoniobacterales bacterium]